MDYNNELYHHGVKGMKWGVRRYRNSDGSLTAAGKKRYSDEDSKTNESSVKKNGLSNRQKTAVKIAVGTAAVAGIVAGAYGAKKYVDAKSNKLVVAKGKALYDHIASTTPWHDGPSFSRAMISASTQSSEFVSRPRKFSEKVDIMRDYSKVARASSKGLGLNDLDTRWMHYMKNP